jgi:hypothetical protein
MYDEDPWADVEAVETMRHDADLEMAQMDARANHLYALRKRGTCTHSSTVGYVGKVIYPAQEGLKPGQSRCTEGTGGCKRVFGSNEEWFTAMDEL